MKDYIMRNPFAKDHTTVWIATIAIGAITAAAVAYFYFTRREEEVPEEHHEQEYLKHPGKKKKKTDPDDLEPIAQA
jgi:hypothetical protein